MQRHNVEPGKAAGRKAELGYHGSSIPAEGCRWQVARDRSAAQRYPHLLMPRGPSPATATLGLDYRLRRRFVTQHVQGVTMAKPGVGGSIGRADSPSLPTRPRSKAPPWRNSVR